MGVRWAMDGEHERPPSSAGPLITRRALIANGLSGAAGLALLPSVLAACGASIGSPRRAATPVPSPSRATPSPLPTPAPTPTDFLAGKLSGSLTVGSLFSDGPTRAAMEAVDAAFAGETGMAPSVNTLEPGTYASATILTAVTRTGGDVVSWYADSGFRQYAKKGLLVPIDDVWALVGARLLPGFAATVTGADGHVYGLPFEYAPWLFFYRKSLWRARGYEIPRSWDALLALCSRMRKDGLTPVAFADKDGWPAEATFDILNLRLNGYDFHIGLLTGTYKWTDSRVARVFEAWRRLIAYSPPNSADMTWQEATASLAKKSAGMFYMGTFISGEIAFKDPSGSVLNDIDVFPFPFFGNEFDVEKAIEAPADVWLIPSQSPSGKANLDNAKAYLQFWARGSTQLSMARAGGMVPTARDADLGGLGPLSARTAPFVAEAQRITQFMDRDTRPDFAGAQGMQGFLLSFIRKPSQDLASLGKAIQDFWDGLPPSE